MKKILAILMLMAAVLPAIAADPESLVHFTGRYAHNRNTNVVEVTGRALDEYDLDTYRGITIANLPTAASDLARTVLQDAKNAQQKELTYREGKLYYAFLTLKPKSKKNRYLFYCNGFLDGTDQIVLVYMTGNADTDKIKKMLKK